MKNRIYLLLMFMLPFSSYAHEYKNTEILEPTKTNSIITGFWNFSYPAPSGEYGYIFTSSNKFIYFKTLGDHIKGYYIATIGNWKIIENKLSLKATKTITNQDGARKETTVNIQKWVVFSDLRSFNYYWHPGAEKNSFPPLIKIREFSGELSTPYVKDYFKFDNEEQSKIKHKFFFGLIGNKSYNKVPQPTQKPRG